MDFTFTEEENAIRAMAKRFQEKEIAPYAKEWDENNIFPIETLRKAAALGFGGLFISQDKGGSALDHLSAALIFEELAQACPSTTAYLSTHNMVGGLINEHANEELKAVWLPKMATLEALSSYCLTEPQSGSDAASLKTTAKRSGETYIVNGTKAFISGGSISDLYVCMVRTGEEGPKGITCLLIEKDRKGISFGQPEKKLGWHSQITTNVFFDQCPVPISNRIGEEGEGFKIALSALNGGRVNIAACSLGGAKYCLQMAHDYMLERTQFNRKLADFEVLQTKFATLLTNWEAARLLVYRAALALDKQEENGVKFCAMAKRFAAENCFDICHQALQLYGGYGYIKDYPIERYFRDLRVHQILEGTSEIMQLIIARQVFREGKLW